MPLLSEWFIQSTAAHRHLWDPRASSRQAGTAKRSEPTLTAGTWQPAWTRLLTSRARRSSVVLVAARHLGDGALHEWLARYGQWAPSAVRRDSRRYGALSHGPRTDDQAGRRLRQRDVDAVARRPAHPEPDPLRERGGCECRGRASPTRSSASGTDSMRLGGRLRSNGAGLIPGERPESALRSPRSCARPARSGATVTPEAARNTVIRVARSVADGVRYGARGRRQGRPRTVTGPPSAGCARYPRRSPARRVGSR